MVIITSDKSYKNLELNRVMRMVIGGGSYAHLKLVQN